MDGRGRSGWLRALTIVVMVLVVGGIGYAIGLGSGSAGVATAAGAPVVYAPWGFGFGFFGFLFPILLLLLLFGAFSGGRRSGRHWGGGYGRRGWYGPDGTDQGGPGVPRDVPLPFEPMLESWHRRAHGESDPNASTPKP